MTHREFERAVCDGIDAIPEKFLKLLSNVAIVIADLASPEQLKRSQIRNPYALLGLYEGLPQTARWGYNAALPDKITIFKLPIEAAAESEEAVRDLIRDTIWHEIAHHFGMDEKRVRNAERKRVKRR